MSEWTPDLVLYHFPCDDGFASAWVARRRWPEVELRGVNYGQPLPPEWVEGKNVLIADFSYPLAILMAASVVAKGIVVLDHHLTAEAELGQLPLLGDPPTAERAGELFALIGNTILVRFDMARSGAVLTWEFCYPGRRLPRLIDHIQARDLWTAEAGSRARHASMVVRSYPYEFAEWDYLVAAADDEITYRDMLTEGEAIERYHQRLVGLIAATATRRDFDDHADVMVCYAPYEFVSDVGHRLLEDNSAAPFAAIGVYSYGGLTWSLRSQDHREDVSAIAKKHGGGGHRNAAGFRVVI